jgi:hypothetical protein
MQWYNKAGARLALFIFPEFSWKSIAIEPPNHNKTPYYTKTLQDSKCPHLLGRLNLEIILSKYMPLHMRDSETAKDPTPNGDSLTDDASDVKHSLSESNEASSIFLLLQQLPTLSPNVDNTFSI